LTIFVSQNIGCSLLLVVFVDFFWAGNHPFESETAHPPLPRTAQSSARATQCGLLHVTTVRTDGTDGTCAISRLSGPLPVSLSLQTSSWHLQAHAPSPMYSAILLLEPFNLGIPLARLAPMPEPLGSRVLRNFGVDQ